MEKQEWRKARKEVERQIKALVPNMENRAGIYIWYRKKYCFYAGQSVKLVDRSVSHLMQYDHLGRSIQKYGLYSKDNPWGWNLTYFYCDEWELNDLERETIAKWNEHNISYNITSGGQNEGKVDINQRQAPKGYRDGLAQGRKNAYREIANLFTKWLDVSIKGEPNKVKQRKLGEFTELVAQFIKESEKVAGKGENE